MLIIIQLLCASISWSIICMLLGNLFAAEQREMGSFTKNFTKEELLATQQLRFNTMDILEDEYEYSDEFLVKWLRETNMNIKTASQMLRNAKMWKEENEMSSILNEKFELKGVPPKACLNVGYDNSGHPVSFLRIGSVNVRKILISGQGREAALRFMLHCLEDSMSRVRNAYLTNKNISQAICIIDGAGYSMKNQACVECVRFYISLLQLVNQYYPGVTRAFIFINIPSVGRTLLDFGLKFAPKDVAVKIFGFDRTEWMEYLRTIIPVNQLPVQYGGSLSVS